MDGRLSTFFAIRMGAYLRLGDHQPFWRSGWVLIGGWALINLLCHQGGCLWVLTRDWVIINLLGHQGGRLSNFLVIRVGAYSRLGAYKPSWSTGWALIRGWAITNLLGHQDGRLLKVGRLSTILAIRVGAYSRLGAYKPSWRYFFQYVILNKY